MKNEKKTKDRTKEKNQEKEENERKQMNRNECHNRESRLNRNKKVSGKLVPSFDANTSLLRRKLDFHVSYPHDVCGMKEN